MKSVEESLREIVAFSEKQLAAEMRRLKQDGESKKNVKADAYATIIGVLSSMLPKNRDKRENETDDARWVGNEG